MHRLFDFSDRAVGFFVVLAWLRWPGPRIEVTGFFMNFPAVLHALLLLGLGCVLGSRAQDRVDTTLTLPSVLVEEQRVEIAAATGQRRWRLETTDLESAEAITVAELLEARTGLFVKRYGSSGLATFSLRGSSATQTLLLIDGHRVADPQSGLIDLTLLPTALLESVEVVHGPAAAAYGSGAIGGVVRLHTLRPSAQLGGRGTLRLGAYGERSIGTVVHGGAGKVALLGAVERSRTGGAYPYPNPFPPPRMRRREGADRQMTTVFGKVRFEGSWRLEGTLWLTTARRSLPSPGNAPPVDARQTDRQQRLLLRAERPLSSGRLSLRGSYQRTWLAYINRFARESDTTRTRGVALAVALDQVLNASWALRVQAEAQWEQAALRGRVDQRLAALAAHLTGRRGRLGLDPALRLDLYATAGRSFLALSPQLGLNLTLRANQLYLKGFIGRAFRAPTLGERFYRPGGNPDLRPEQGWTTEFGLYARVRLMELELTAFQTMLTNQIVWYPGLVAPGLQLWRPVNVGRVRTRGLEASLRTRLSLTPHVHLQGGLFYTLTRAEDRSHPGTRAYGRQLRYVPLHQLKAFLDGQLGPIWLGIQVRRTGQRYLTTDETQALTPFTVLDARLGVQQRVASVRLALSLTVENLTDTAYEVVRFYPMPPRHLRVQLRLDLLP
ncbi:TonB-dependent receptor plug domain-containing protein [Rhodothermus profundi]|uniref:Iron complex outermembrane recepter protein n=1 Tax=Rhodothermus profundi TaxID=633813 RepID=A0A1M6RHX9_9BACT|nr:TonB-dependent receptor [Rhodothermus profundi]SHK32034.1 iron complex outermembrane recepter protein [Rhodothermus profundi]